MTDRQKAEERLAKELDVTKDSDGRFMWVKHRGAPHPAGYEIPCKLWNALVSRELELEKYRSRRPNSFDLARRFHTIYEALASQFGYETRKESARPWSQVPERQQTLMITTCAHIINEYWPLPEAPREGQ